jgi:hypothetical protein
MASEDEGQAVLERTFFWTMVMGVCFVVANFGIAMNAYFMSL